MKNFAYRTLVFLKIVDEHDKNISISNIALLIMLGKLVVIQNASMMDLGSVMIAMMNYSYKKYINKDSIMKAQTIMNTVISKSEEILPDQQ